MFSRFDLGDSWFLLSPSKSPLGATSDSSTVKIIWRANTLQLSLPYHLLRQNGRRVNCQGKIIIFSSIGLATPNFLTFLASANSLWLVSPHLCEFSRRHSPLAHPKTRLLPSGKSQDSSHLWRGPLFWSEFFWTILNQPFFNSLTILKVSYLKMSV